MWVPALDGGELRVADDTGNPGSHQGTGNAIKAEVDEQVIHPDPEGLAAPPHGGIGLLITPCHEYNRTQQQQCDQRPPGITETVARLRSNPLKQMSATPQQHTAGQHHHNFTLCV